MAKRKMATKTAAKKAAAEMARQVADTDLAQHLALVARAVCVGLDGLGATLEHSVPNRNDVYGVGVLAGQVVHGLEAISNGNAARFMEERVYYRFD